MLKAGLTTIIGALVFQTGAMAQIYVKSPGDVGIGITTPSTKLHVNGDITAGSAGGGYHLIVNDIPTARWALGTGNYGFHIASDYPVTTTWTDKFVLSREGYVGIGIAQPTARLTLADAGAATLRVGVNSNMANTYTQLLNSMAVLGVDQNDISSCGAVASDFFNNGNSPTWAGTILFHYGNGLNPTEDIYPNVPVKKKNLGMLHFQNQSNGLIVASGNVYISAGYNTPTTFLGNGNVGIGTTNPTYKLHVNGGVWANNYVAASPNNYADYVFDSTYQLPTLQSVEAYIKQNHHLPEVPSEADVTKDGINLGDHQVVLLKKIEELTLYAIDQHKEQKAQNEKLQLLEQKLIEILEENNTLKKEVKELQTKTQKASR
jgi:hypothetical protein